MQLLSHFLLKITIVSETYCIIKENMTQTEWWNKEVYHTFQTYRVVAITSLLGTSVIRSLSYLLGYDFIQTKLQVFIVLLSLPICWLLLRTKPHQSKLQYCTMLLMNETLCTWLWYSSLDYNENHRILISIFCTLIFIIFECSVTKSKVLFVVLCGKHLAQWYFYKYYTLGLTIPEANTPFSMLTIFVLILWYHLHHIRTLSFQNYFSQKQLQSVKNSLNTLFDAFPDGVCILDRDFNVLMANNFTKSLFSCSVEEITQKLREKYYMPERQIYFGNRGTSVLEDITECFTNNEEFQAVLGLFKHNQLNLEISAKTITWEQTPALLLNMRNVTNLISLEKISAENRYKNAMLRTVSHEIRTPANAIISYVEEILQEYQSQIPGEVKKFVEIISTSSKHLLALISDILDYSRIIAGVFSVQKDNFEFRKLLDDVVILFEKQAGKKGIKLTKRIDEMIPKCIYTDPKRLTQVLINLLGNSLKYTNKGSIEVCVFINTKNFLEVLIKDSGIGIHENKIRDLFQLFGQVHSPQLGIEGCGLGLNISNLLVNHLGGGNIYVHSQIGKGSTFGFEIPVMEAYVELEFEEDSAEPPLDITNHITVRNFECFRKDISESDVLVVDDDSFSRDIIGSILKRNGISFKEVSNGNDAIKCVWEAERKTKGFKVIVMDCCMPLMDGWQTCQKLMSLYNSRKIMKKPVIIGYTGNISSQDVQRCYECGMVLYLSKPVDAQTLINSINQFF